MAPPTQGVAIHLRIPADLLAELDRLAELRGITRAEALRSAVRQYVEGAES